MKTPDPGIQVILIAIAVVVAGYFLRQPVEYLARYHVAASDIRIERTFHLVVPSPSKEDSSIMLDGALGDYLRRNIRLHSDGPIQPGNPEIDLIPANVHWHDITGAEYTASGAKLVVRATPVPTNGSSRSTWSVVFPSMAEVQGAPQIVCRAGDRSPAVAGGWSVVEVHGTRAGLLLHRVSTGMLLLHPLVLLATAGLLLVVPMRQRARRIAEQKRTGSMRFTARADWPLQVLAMGLLTTAALWLCLCFMAHVRADFDFPSVWRNSLVRWSSPLLSLTGIAWSAWSAWSERRRRQTIEVSRGGLSIRSSTGAEATILWRNVLAVNTVEVLQNKQVVGHALQIVDDNVRGRHFASGDFDDFAAFRDAVTTAFNRAGRPPPPENGRPIAASAPPTDSPAAEAARPLPVCKLCGETYDPANPTPCSYHPQEARPVGRTGPRRECHRYFFECCSEEVDGWVLQLRPEELPPRSPGCVTGKHAS